MNETGSYEYDEQKDSALEQPDTAGELAQKASETVEPIEVQESNEAGKTGESGEEGKEALGYSSEYYKQEMANAIKNGNQIAYKYAQEHYAEAKVRETTS